LGLKLHVWQSIRSEILSGVEKKKQDLDGNGDKV